MVRTRLLILASAALLAWPAAAAFTAEAPFKRDAKGDFLFKNYPPRALAAGEEGRVGFQVNLNEKGDLTSCQVTESSGYASLDKETCDIMAGHAVFTAVRDANGRATAAAHRGYVNWKLPEGYVKGAAAPTQTASATTTEKMICKREVKTGSLVGKSKTCMTESEWTRMTNRTRGDWGQMQGRNAAWDNQ